MSINVIRTTIVCAFTAMSVTAMGQDLIARQAPVDKKMRAVDSVAIQRLFEQENVAEEPAENLYPNWGDEGINLYGNVELPKDFKIDLRHFCMPITNRVVTSNYGYRARFRRQHKGIDIDAYRGDTIRAAFDGKVRVVDFQPRGYGNVVVIRHPNGLETVYGHLSKHLITKDAMVHAGDPIGLAGSTGRSTGTHLHFETRLLGEYIDPAKLFDFAHQDVTGDFYVFNGRGRGTILGRHTVGEQSDDVASTDQEVTYDSSLPNQGSTSKSASRTRFHKVRRGETLSTIARKHGTTVSALCRLNGISRSSKLRAGQVLKYS